MVRIPTSLAISLNRLLSNRLAEQTTDIWKTTANCGKMKSKLSNKGGGSIGNAQAEIKDHLATEKFVDVRLERDGGFVKATAYIDITDFGFCADTILLINW